MSKAKLRWKSQPEAEDYAGASRYLETIYSQKDVEAIIRRLRRAPESARTAKDLLRASDLPLLPLEDPHVAEDMKRIHRGKPLPPVLLVRGDMRRGIPLVVADGYHRICASCHHDEAAPIPCLMA